MKKIHPLISILILLLLAYLLGLFALHIYANQRTIPNGIMVGGLPVGGLAPQDALALLDQRLLQLEQQPMVYYINENTGSNQLTGTMGAKETKESNKIKIETTIKQSGITYHTDDFRAAMASLSQGSLWKRMRVRSQFPKEWSIQAQIDETKLREWFNPTWEKENLGMPVDAVRTITDNDLIQYSPDKVAQRIDWSSFIPSLYASLPKQFPMNKPTAIEIGVPLKTLAPKVTLASLKAQGIERKISMYSTSAIHSSEGRIHNLSSVVQTLDGMILAPNGIFDYEKVIDTAEVNFGFRSAPVIIGGKLVTGIGGGICQISSTLYNAAVQSGLEIVERRNHSLPVSYVPKGQDATFAKGYINFRFKNNTKHYMLIKASAKQGIITIKLFGNIPEDVRYEIETKQIKKIPTSTKYVINQALAQGQKEIITKGNDGYIIDSYRVKIVAGRIVEKKKLFRDTYPANPSIIAIPPY
ncbi:vancomycin resistance protein YoaR [Paenibacillus turicensis]|uniref:Vancomycin resistance protein YoaR n=1 Tax=Paenibacillus turicensis TaxID=160487 RepID=A0ABS4FX98_9BACL|nr:VanW family protein [Paenibacillus turicensis]MBP1907202.1 vancomycin resistance protein YoaR [Paenibacillus turicensis]